MKKIAVAVAIVAVIIFGIFAYGKVFLLPQQRVYSMPLREVQGTFVIVSGKEYSFGERFSLERYTENRWSKMYKNEANIGINDVLLLPKTGSKLFFDMRPYQEYLRAGKYRIVIDAKEDKTKAEKKIYCYFSIR